MPTSKLIQIVLINVFLLTAIIISYIMTTKNKHSTNKIPLKSKDKLIIGLLTIFYACISLTNLGSSAKSSSYIPLTNQSVNINVNTPITLGKIAYYYGLGSGSFELKYYKLNGTTGTIDLTNKNIFKWQFTTTNQADNIIKIEIIPKSLPIELRQLAFYDDNNQFIANLSIDQVDNPTKDLNQLIASTPPNYTDNTLMSSMYFDEIYYARTALEYLRGQAPFVWVHPPLSMLLIGLGILLFGMNPLGWRIMPAMCGIAMVPIIYLFALKLFNNRKSAIIASLLLIFDFMHFSINRMASIDSYSTLWIFCELYFLYSYLKLRLNNMESMRNIFYCGIFLGLAIATKWDAFFTIPVILLVIIYLEIIKFRTTLTKFSYNVSIYFLCLVVTPLLIYALCYIPYYIGQRTNNFAQFIYQVQLNIYNFHTGLSPSITHPYASKWWSWPLIIKPMSVYFWMSKTSDMSSSIVLMGNPIIWWSGSLAFIYSIIKLKWSHNSKLVFLLLTISALYLPWMIIGRLSFIYYFYVVSPLLILLITYYINLILNQHKQLYNRLIIIYLLITLLLFVAFYPALSGLEVPRDYIVNYLLWIRPEWNF